MKNITIGPWSAFEDLSPRIGQRMLRDSMQSTEGVEALCAPNVLTQVLQRVQLLYLYVKPYMECLYGKTIHGMHYWNNFPTTVGSTKLEYGCRVNDAVFITSFLDFGGFCGWSNSNLLASWMVSM